MTNEQLQDAVSRILCDLFSSVRVQAPICAVDLLSQIIDQSLARSSTERPILRLSDLSRFESILESFSRHWEKGFLTAVRDDSGVTVMDVQLSTTNGSSTIPTTGTLGKRKRVKDEDADSAAGSGDEADDGYEEMILAGTTVSGLSKELKEVYAILQKSTAKGKILAEQFRSMNGAFEPICSYVTKDDCMNARAALMPPQYGICTRVHFRPLIRPHTDPTLGHCSYLNTCYSEPTYAQSPSIPPLPSAQNPVNAQWPKPQLPSGLGAGGRGKEKAPCRYLHYEVDFDPGDAGNEVKRDERPVKKPYRLPIGLGPTGQLGELMPPQWINCDVRRFDYSVLGKFHVIMADPPWDIHMSLPYGTMTDDEMRAMPIPALQDEGLLFLWVTGRAMEVGRECMRHWGYTRVDEVVWIKTNQLQRVIRTGRTGHWLNHTKEHMLVGIKTNYDKDGSLKFPSWVNRGLDTDVIVSEVRETSRKPDEVYGLIERMCPGGRKIEIFGRKHNTRPGWLTLGNQLGSDQIFEEDLAAKIAERYAE
ncbi:MT-A70-domain-containing protein [Vararia minispora EC-137]|uniref:MT-A70-domain-containing protein n=1 Tax=Vararia minispora EC-137 TaxID=1314806 RepID=A0ACB8QWV5_9AGAM|nr:MT-A70-domain-containing protein [Vararia minispora EC-137]